MQVLYYEHKQPMRDLRPQVLQLVLVVAQKS
ncbi:uncharacterized protein METZ01_LOCUS12426 [marine metagenome]|uniref:Uncharacterized protein n=1 Tax=marine metagenome TaxID=408172 RepID=A0A381NY72_9ZZZZ